MNVVKVSFEITDNWNREEFRQFTKKLKNNSLIDLWIITSDSDNSLLLNVQNYLDINSSHIIQVTNNVDKKNEIINNQIKVHFDNNIDFSDDLSNTTNPKIWGIHISNFYNFYKMKMRYVDKFDYILKYEL